MIFHHSQTEPSAIILTPPLDYRELELHTSVILDMNCLMDQREDVGQIEHGVERTLHVQVTYYLNDVLYTHARIYYQVP